MNHKVSHLSASQALKTLGLSQRLKTFVDKKFNNEKKTLKQWQKVFVEENIS